MWYDNYELCTAFITDESFSDTDDPHVVAEGIPYEEAVKMVAEHNRLLQRPATINVTVPGKYKEWKE